MKQKRKKIISQNKHGAACAIQECLGSFREFTEAVARDAMQILPELGKAARGRQNEIGLNNIKEWTYTTN